MASRSLGFTDPRASRLYYDHHPAFVRNSTAAARMHSWLSNQVPTVLQVLYIVIQHLQVSIGIQFI